MFYPITKYCLGSPWACHQFPNLLHCTNTSKFKTFPWRRCIFTCICNSLGLVELVGLWTRVNFMLSNTKHKKTMKKYNIYKWNVAITPVSFLLWHVQMPAVQNVYCATNAVQLDNNSFCSKAYLRSHPPFFCFFFLIHNFRLTQDF